MNTLQNIEVARQMAREHERSLRPAAPAIARDPGRSHVRRWIGLQLVRTGFWLAYERPMRPVAAR